MNTTSYQENQMKKPLPLTDRERHYADDTAGFAPFKARHVESSKCLVYLLAFVVAFCAFLLVFALIFLRFSPPRAKLTSVTVKTLKYTSYPVNTSSNATASPPPSLNVTLTAAMVIKNSNLGHFDYGNSTASVFFEGEEVGRGTVARGSVGAHGTARVSVTVEVGSVPRVENSTGFRSGIDSGVLKLRSYAEVRGRVHFIDIIKSKKISILSCTMNLNLRNRTIEELVCS